MDVRFTRSKDAKLMAAASKVGQKKNSAATSQDPSQVVDIIKPSSVQSSQCLRKKPVPATEVASEDDGMTDGSDDVEPSSEDMETKIATSYDDHEPRYAANRRGQLENDHLFPELTKHSNRVFNPTFASVAASERYASTFSLRDFHTQRYIAHDDPNIQEAFAIIEQAGLVYTVVDVIGFVDSVVREFYANLGDLDCKSDTTRVYVRGKKYEFPATIINQLFQVTVPDELDDWEAVPIAVAIADVTGGRKHHWEGTCTRHLTPTMAVLYNTCCMNWTPDSNNSTLNPRRVKFIHAVHTKKRFNFGRLVYDLIVENSNIKNVNGLLTFPSFIYRLLYFQRLVPVRPHDQLIDLPLALTLDEKSGKGSDHEDEAEPN
ncbi:unnamed protein product [Arabis nemorensis]|uniref:Putative plant transposon protein domain-containing protein n=1 Tax=Arabis nemorensis TaxID=586526 RepID=A0A565CMY2_9BRAS|nr:unnamed protein product [Arabis nemorensis]